MENDIQMSTDRTVDGFSINPTKPTRVLPHGHIRWAHHSTTNTTNAVIEPDNLLPGMAAWVPTLLRFCGCRQKYFFYFQC